MAQSQTYSFSLGTSFNVVTHDAYLILVAGEKRAEISVAPFDKNVANSSSNLLNTGLKNAVAKGIMAGVTSPIAQNLASKYLPSAVLGRINSSLYDIMADGQIQTQEVAEDFIGSCTNALDNVATDLGFPTPSALYSAISPKGTGVISKDLVGAFTNAFSKRSAEQNDELNNQQENLPENLLIVKMRLVQSDTENLGINIPTRKTEKNFNIATAVNNENLERTFEAKIVHNDNKGLNMIELKNRLKTIREMRNYIDVYICDSDINEIEFLPDCLLSSLSFDIEDKNCLSCSLGVTKLPQWDVTIDATLDKSLSQPSTATTKRKVSGNNAKNKKVVTKAPKDFIIASKSAELACKDHLEKYQTALTNHNTKESAYQLTKLTNALNRNFANQRTNFTETQVSNMVKGGATVIKIDVEK